MELIVKRTGHTLIAADQWQQIELDEMPIGQEILVKISSLVLTITGYPNQRILIFLKLTIRE